MGRFLVYSNIWVALTTACFSLLLHSFSTFDCARFAFVALGTLFIYSSQRLVKFYILNLRTGQEKEQWMLANLSLFLTITFAAFIGFIILSLHFYRQLLQNLPLFGALGLIAIFYVVPFYKKVNLRNIPYTKIIWVGLVYSFFSIFLINPYLPAHLADKTILFSVVFCYIVGITLLFDYRDKGIDEAHIKTIPQLAQPKNIFVLSLTLQVLALLLMSWLGYLCVKTTFALVVVHLLVFWLFKYPKTTKEENYALWFEGLIAFTGICGFLSE